MTIVGSVQGFVFDAVPVLLDAAVKGMGLLAAAGALVLAMRKTSAAARQVVWVLALAAMLVLPLASAALPSWQVLPGWAKIEMPSEPAAMSSVDPAGSTESSSSFGSVGRGRPEMSSAPAHAVMQPTATLRQYPNESPADVPPSAAVATVPDSREAPAPVDVAAGTVAGSAKSWRSLLVPVALAVWLAGTLACLFPLLLGRLSLRRLARGSQRIEGGSWAVLLKRAAQTVGLGRRVRLLQSDIEPMPMVWGVLGSKLLLPAEADDWSAQRRWVVLLHELAHIKRHDCLAKMVAHVACAAYWFNPLCWIAFRLMQREAEAACDDLVLSADHASTGLVDLRPSDYAQHLLEIASGLKSPDVVSGLVAYSSIAMARPSKLEGRLRAILDDRRNRRALTRLGILVAAVVVAGIAVPLAIVTTTSTSDTPSSGSAILPEEAYEFARQARILASGEFPDAREAAMAMGKLKSPAVVDTLIDALKKADAQTAMGIGISLGKIGNPKAIPALIALFDRKDALDGLASNPLNANLASVAHWSLVQITSSKTGSERTREGLAMIPVHVDSMGSVLADATLAAVRDAWRAKLTASMPQSATQPAALPTSPPTRSADVRHHTTPPFKIRRRSGAGAALEITSSRVSVSNDGLMVAPFGRRYHLVNVATGKEIKCLDAPTDGYWCISPDGKMAASSRGIVVDVMTGRQIAQPGNGSLGAAAMPQFSNDGRTLALFTGEAAFIYDTKTWKRKQTFTGPAPHITDISAGTMSADGSTVVIRMGVRTDGNPPQWLSLATSVYDVASGRKLMSTPRGSRYPTLSRDGKLVAIENEVIDVASGRTLLRGAASMRCAAISPAGDVVAVFVSGDTAATKVDDGRIELWNVATGKLISQLACSDSLLDSLKFSSDAKLLIGHSGHVTDMSYIWQVASATPVAGGATIGSRSVAQNSIGAAISQPVARTSAGVLEFRIAPVRSAAFGRKNLQWYQEILRQGDVGFCFKKTERFIGRMPDHAWLLATRGFSGNGSITELYDHKTYMLVSDKPQERLVPGSGADQWRLLRVDVGEIDAEYTRTIDLELDQRGGELMAELTSRNLNKHLAVIVDGKVLSVPVIKATSKTHFQIVGVQKDEAQVIVPLLRKGIQSAAIQPAPSPLTWRDEESETLRVLSSEKLRRRIGTAKLHASAEPPGKFSDKGKFIDGRTPDPDDTSPGSAIVGHFYQNLRPGLTLIIRARVNGQSRDVYWAQTKARTQAFHNPPPPLKGQANTQTGKWTHTQEYPVGIVALAEQQGRKKSATPWRFQGVAPQVLSDGKGRYRVAWVKKDPLRDSYWYDWYEFDGVKLVASGFSSIPSPLKVPDITKAPGWDGPLAKAPATKPTKELSVSETKALEGLWEALADTDVDKARAAIWTLASKPNTTAGFLAGRLRPAGAGDAESIRRLIADLDNKAAAVRNAATSALTSLDCVAEAALAEAAKSRLSAEAGMRVVQLLGACRKPLLATKRTRQMVRGIWALETMAGPQGRAALTLIAKADERHRASGLARAALARLDGNPGGAGQYAPKLRYVLQVRPGAVKAGGSIPIEARLINEGKVPVAVYWGDYAYEDMYRFAIRRDGEPVPAPRDRFAPPGGVESRRFRELAPGGSLDYEMFLGSIGANCQRYFLRHPGKYTIEPSLAVAVTTCFDPQNRREMSVPGAWLGQLEAAPVSITINENPSDKGSVTVSGRVVDAVTGKPVPGAKVVLIARRPPTGFGHGYTGHDGPIIEQQTDYAFTDANGRFSFGRLPEDVPQFSLRLTHADYSSASAIINFAPPKKQYQATITMHPGIRVRGRIVDSANLPVVGARVSHADKDAFADRQGRFVLSGVTASEHEGKSAVWVDVWKKGFVRVQSWSAPRQAQAGQWDITIRPESELAFSGRAVFADGSAVAGVAMDLRLKDAAGKAAYARGKTDGDGRFSIVLSRAGEFVGKAEATGAKLRGYGSPRERWLASVTGVNPGRKNVRIVFEDRGAIRAAVRPANTLPKSLKFRVLCDMANVEGQYQTVRSSVLDSIGGTATMDRLSPGKYRVKVTAVPQEHWHWTKEVVLDANALGLAAELDFLVPEKKFGNVRATILAPDGKTPVAKGRVWMDSSASWGGFPIVNGVVELKDIPVGKVWLTTTVDGTAGRKLEGLVRDGQTTDLGRIVLQRLEDATGVVAGRVLYDDGTPAIGAVLVGDGFDKTPVGSDGKYSVRRFAGKGTVVVDLAAASGWPAAAANMDRLGAPWGADRILATADVPAGGTVKLDIVLPRKKVIDLAVDFRAKKKTSVNMTVAVELDRYRLVRTWFSPETDPGIIRIPNLPSGPTTVSLHAANMGYRACQAVAESKLKDPLVFDPSVTGKLTVRTVDPTGKAVKGVRLSASSELMAWLKPVRGLRSNYFPISEYDMASGKTVRVQRELADGTHELTGLAPGAYIVQATGETGEVSAKPLRAQVQAGKTTSIKLVVETDDVAETPAARPPASQPAGGRLEFRIAPYPSAMDKAELRSCMDWLKAGRVGFWWKGGRIAGIAGRMPNHAWLPITGELAGADQLVTGEYNGRKYILVSDKPDQVMVLGQGKKPWYLAKVYAVKDGSGKPAVGFELDARGAELFAALTKANIRNALAIVINGEVISAPMLMSPMGKRGMITGRFSGQEVKDLVKVLKVGMAPAKPLSATTQPASLPASAPIDPVAVWEAKVGQAITVQGHAFRDKTGVRFLRPKGDTYPYRIELENVLPDLRGGGKPLLVRVTGTLRLRKHTVGKEEVEQYKRDLAENRKQMQLSDPKVGQIIRHYYIPDAVVTILPAATEAASQPAKASPLAGLKLRLVLADKRKEYRIGETIKFNVLAENTGKQAVEFSLTRFPPVAYSNTTEGGMIRLHEFSGFCGGETLDEKFVIKPGRSTLLDTEEYILMPPDWMGNTNGRPGVIGVKPQRYSVSYRLHPQYSGQTRTEKLDSEPLVAIDVLPGDPERIRQLTAKYPSGREVAEKFALEFLAAIRKGDAETMNRMIQLHQDFGPKNPGSGVSSAADYAERKARSQEWWQDMARQLRAIYAGPKYLPGRLSETYCLPENSPRPGAAVVRIAGPAGSRDKCLWLELSCCSDGWRVKNAGFADSKTSMKQLLIDMMAEAHRASTQPATKSSGRPKAVGPWITIAPRQETVASIEDLRVLYRGLNLPIAVGRSGQWEIRTADQRTIATVPVRLTITTEPVEGVRNIRSNSRGLDKDELKLIGQLPDGEYRLAWKVGDKRLSNVMRFRIKKDYTPRDEPLLSLAEIESVPGELPLLLVRAYRHKQQDPAPRAMEVACATLNVDGRDLFAGVRAWSGPDEPLKVGGCYAYLLNLRYYSESEGAGGFIKLGKKHVVFAKAGPEEEVRGMPPLKRVARSDRRSAQDRVTVQSAPITLRHDRSLGLQWDQATRNHAQTEPTTQPAVAGTDIERLIAQLAGETSAQREAAQQALVKIGLPAAAALRAACKDNNAERAQRAKVALMLIEEAVAREAMRKAIGQMSALSQGWAEPAADAAEIGRQIKRLGSETFAERKEAQQALVKIGLPAAEALQAAAQDADSERAARAKDALDQLALRKEDWPISWGGMTCSFRMLSTDPTKCMALSLDENRRALLIKWSPADKSLIRTEATLSQKDADVLHRSLGRLELWRLNAAMTWPVDDTGRQELTVTVGGRFVRLVVPLQIRNLPRTQDTAQLIGGLMGVDAAVQHLTAVIQKEAAIREQAAKAGNAAPERVPPAPGADETGAAAELIAKATRLGQPVPTGELHGKERTAAMKARDAADLAMHKYKGTYGVSGHRFPPRKADPSTPAGRKAFAEVERLYREAIDKAGLTDIGVYTRLRLSGAYRYHGEPAKADAMKIESEQLQPVVEKLKEKHRLRIEGADWPELAAVIRVLRRPGDVSREEITGALTKLDTRGDEAVGRLMADFWPSSDYAYRWRTIKALGLINSPRSRKALLDLALGTNKSSLPWIRGAAREYVKTLTDKSEARQLLVSADTAVLQQAAVGLNGVAIDKEMIDRLVELMKSPDRHLRLLVVYVFANDPGGLFTSRKVAAIVQGIPDIATMDKADGVAWPSNYTNAESHYRTYINGLATMVNAAKPIQDQIALAPAGGLTWRCLVLSRGLGGDAKVRPEARKILADSKAGLFRAWAAEAMGKIGTADDLPLLRQVAKKDPMQRERGGCLAPINKDIVYPVREVAQAVIKTLQAAPAAPGSRGSAVPPAVRPATQPSSPQAAQPGVSAVLGRGAHRATTP